MKSSIARRALIVVALVAAAAGAGLWWLSQQTALEWLIAEAVKRSNGALSIEGARGSLFGPISARRVVYDAEGWRITLEDIKLGASPRELARGHLAVSSLEVQVLQLTVKPSATAPQPPASLALPLPVNIERVSIKQAELRGYRLHDVAFAYAGGPHQHALRGFRADSDAGRLELDVQVGAQAPFALTGTVALARDEGSSARLALAGSLMRTEVDASGKLRGAEGQVRASIAAFEPRWLQNFTLHAENIDLAAFRAELPATRLTLDVSGASGADGLPTGSLEARNLRAGTLNAGRLPVVSAKADFALRDERVLLSRLTASLGAGGSIAGTMRIGRDAGSANLKMTALNLRGLYDSLRATRLTGTASVEFGGAEQYLKARFVERGIDIALDGVRRGDEITLRQFRAAAGAGEIRGTGLLSLAHPRQFSAHATLARLDPSLFGDYPPAAINGELKVTGALAPDWRADAALVLSQSLFRGTRLAGSAAAELTALGARNVTADLTAGANQLHASGAIGRSGDALVFALDARRLADLDARLTGALSANGRITGDIKQPGFEMEITGSALGWKDRRVDTLRARATGTAGRHAVTLQAKGAQYDLASRIEGGWDARSGWTGTLVSLENKGIYPASLVAPVPVSFGRERLVAGPAEARFAGGRVSLTALSWENGVFSTHGDLANLPVEPFFALAGAPASATDLRVGGSWSLAGAAQLNGTLTLSREAGDIVLPGEQALSLGLQRLRLDARVVNDALDVTLTLEGNSISGNVKAAAASLSRDAALKLDGKLEMATMKLLGPLAGTRVVLDGHASLALAASGTLSAPRLTGTLSAADLKLDAPQYGVRLYGGTLRAELDDKALTLREFTIRAGPGRLTATGTASRAEGGQTNLAWRAENFQALDSPDMRLKVDGAGTIGVAAKKVLVRGEIKAQEGHFAFGQSGAPKLGDDIVIVGRPRAYAKTASSNRFQTGLLDIDVTLDLGDRVHVVGAGINTDLRGKLRVQSTRQGLLEAHGTLVSARGMYFVFGQRLDIERGRLIFDGPLDNPALDILAKRKNLPVEAGVQVTGTAHVPNVQLVSEPPVPDSEKLAWLTLGHGLQEATGADVALLQAAASALVSGGDSLPLSQRIANRVGLDELALRGSGAAGSQVAAFGKRFSDKLYVEYQQGLAATSAVLRLSYVLTRAVSLRLETGFSSSFGVYFTRSYD